ncbi:MAG: hypothetical protein M0Z53_08130 [Thermaerobacter sp.]|nr:hypothetical protein [Thermaerobacter sp.]
MANERTRQTVPPAPPAPQWSRRQLLIGSAGLAAAGATALFAKQSLVDWVRGLVGSPVSSGRIHLYQFDYYFVPNYMTWRVGDAMEILLHNQSPTHWHEWTVGRHVRTEVFEGFGRLSSDGWGTDFWDGVSVVLSDPYQVDNFVPHDAKVSYVGPQAPYQVAQGGDFSPTLKPGGSIRIAFTVPNKPGVWHYGCFVQEFIHFRTGMRGMINILPA